MPSKRRNRPPTQRIEDILENIDRIRRFVGTYDYDAFVADTLYAVTRALEIISEASRHLPAELKARSPHINWRGVAAAGNVYRHGYESIDNSYVWDVIVRDLEPLRTAMILEFRALGEEWSSG